MPRQSVSIPFAKGRRRRHHKDGGAFASHPSGVSIPFAKGRRRRPLPLPGTQPALRQANCFNPLRKGEAAPPLPPTTPYYTILLTVATSDTSKNIDLRVAPKTAPYPSVYTYPLAFPALKAILPCTRFQASLRNSQETAANASDNVKFPVHNRLRRSQHPGPLTARGAQLENMRLVEVRMHQALQPLLHPPGVLFLQVGDEHALLRPRSEIQKAIGNPAPPAVIGYIVTDDVLHGSFPFPASFSAFCSGRQRYGTNAVPPPSAAASFSTSVFSSSRQRGSPSCGRSSIHRSYSPKNFFIGCGARNTPGRSPAVWKSRS